MNNKVVYILIAINLCCVNGGIVSVIKSSTSTVLNWYDYYIKPLWTNQPSVPPDEDIVFYEQQEDNYRPIDDFDDENVILMDSPGDQTFLVYLIRVI